MKKLLSLFLALTVVSGILVGMAVPAAALTDVTDIANTESLKILAIGNSFSEDSTEYLPVLARDLGIKNIVIGNMYIGGCTIEKHAENARENKADYKYYKNTKYSVMSSGPYTKGVSLETALQDEDWDVITLQHSSIHSGIGTYYNKDLDYLLDYVKTLCPNAKIGWHMTWAYQSDCTLSAFKTNYRSNQKYMYESITANVEKYIVPNEKIDFIIPAGTAIQNARSSYLGDTLTRDGYHLDLYLGRYIVGVTWMKALGYSVDNLKLMPNRVRPVMMPFVLECVYNAMETPFAVTVSSYTYEPGTTPPETTVVVQETTASPEPESTDEVTEKNAETTGLKQDDTGSFDYTVLWVVLACVGIVVVVVITVIVVKKKTK